MPSPLEQAYLAGAQAAVKQAGLNSHVLAALLGAGTGAGVGALTADQESSGQGALRGAVAGGLLGAGSRALGQRFIGPDLLEHLVTTRNLNSAKDALHNWGMTHKAKHLAGAAAGFGLSGAGATAGGSASLAMGFTAGPAPAIVGGRVGLHYGEELRKHILGQMYRELDLAEELAKSRHVTRRKVRVAPALLGLGGALSGGLAAGLASENE